MTRVPYDIPVRTLSGQDTTLAEHAGKVMLIVNTASQCGFTPQYAGLEALYREYGPLGLVVLGFPCNQFGAQEPGDSEQIASFCETRFQVSFPMFERIDVNGEHAHPLYLWLKQQASGLLGTEAIKWNFTKFLVSRDASSVERYAPTTTPASLRKDIEALL
ncbi:glutathione peroxidase [Parazoarcus communis]|uniref:Glutathione peroxidase n=1 Tax=Parazoarcus communis SWub3 = DSM 12120 TaxID=1121029 RepID=A0A323UTQ4_9RHOO|nr:glutathione peroxidase [Parazoarcus communis]NMG70997.1 glutathione peroxidase [Parazoarcus communis SWub3 = DSM 12120]PZA15403.1 glutathione peroxidase [Azoarcus communis] [Parazoarcus communis SWub3 = DSM 12120]